MNYKLLNEGMSIMRQAITQSEWEVMRVVWSKNQATNNEIFDVLGDKMGWKMSTIKTLVRRLTQKEFLKAEKHSREYTYIPQVSEQEAFIESAEHLLNQICNKKVGSVLNHFVKEHEMSQADLEALSEIIKEKKKNAPESVPCQCTPGQCNCKKGRV